MRKIRIGSGAGFAGDRIDPAIDLIKYGNLDYIGFECLAERTIALAVRQKMNNPDEGYNDLLEERFRLILPAMQGSKVKIITNMGAANPQAAAAKVAEIARSLNISGVRIAAVTGDDVLALLPRMLELPVLETGQPLCACEGKIISANAYNGIDGILEALRRGANIIITGRVSDPALFLAPIVHEFGWTSDNWQLLGQGTVAGHLLECAAQVTGGYFADPGVKDVPDLWAVGFPIVEISPNGGFTLSKLPGSGGLVSTATVTEQLLYEILDPKAYLTPDVIADFSQVQINQVGPDMVQVRGGSGTAPSGQLKVSVGLDEGFIGEGEISYGGPGAAARARLAGEIIRKRIEYRQIPVRELRIDLLGLHSLYPYEMTRKLSNYVDDGHEIRLRVAAGTVDRRAAAAVGNEVEALYLNGPAGGGGARKYIRPVVGVLSVLIPKTWVQCQVKLLEV
ncbi:MAG: DUF1446 domain-containing protein [Clostridiaceae bacterium]|jgi:hypothetical protein|nr:DUF1446 domain-containing protein [Clostridiaceae bacterium]